MDIDPFSGDTDLPGKGKATNGNFWGYFCNINIREND